MAPKKQQTIEATLGRPKLKTKAPKPRAANRSASSTPNAASSPATRGSSQSWFYAPKSRSSPRTRAPQPPPSSFMPPSSSRKRVTVADSSSSADEDSGLDDSDDDRTPKATQKPSQALRGSPGQGEMKQTQLNLGSTPRSAVVVDDEESSSDDDDLPVATPKVSRRTQKERRKQAEDESEDGEDSDDKPLVTPTPRKRLAPRDDSDEEDAEEEEEPSSRRTTGEIPLQEEIARRPKRARSDDDEDEDEDDDVVVQSTKRRRLARKNGTAVSSSPAPRSSPTKRPHRSEKDKRRELLRRRRAGENITMSDLETSEEEGHALYDTDSDHVALEEFEDDDEGVLNEGPAKRKKKKQKDKKKAKEPREGSGSDEEEDDDFVVDDDDENLGVPADLLAVPLEFTRHARKPLKEHFRDVIEWLVRFKFEPTFDEKQNELYMIGWQRLDDEVAALASSKFASAAWKPEFRRALNARPKFVTAELPRGDLDRLFSTCEACGRSGHPATWTVAFEGTAYHRKNKKDARFLEDVESDEEESDSSSSSPGSHSSNNKAQRDEDGNELPPESRDWAVGAVCQSNAETAHTLIHWKHNLLEWVGDRLENDGLMTPSQIAARARMKRKQKNKVVDDIIAGWERQRVVQELYREFKGVLDDARNKSTTGRRTGRWGR